jgi:hypothetical protein
VSVEGGSATPPFRVVVLPGLRFDAGIMDNEFERAGLGDFRPEWKRIVQNGFCTMAPSLGKWLLTSFGAETKDGSIHGQNTMRLQDLVHLLVKGRSDLKQKKHSAGADAQMHRLLLIEILKLEGRRS